MLSLNNGFANIILNSEVEHQRIEVTGYPLEISKFIKSFDGDEYPDFITKHSWFKNNGSMPLTEFSHEDQKQNLFHRNRLFHFHRGFLIQFFYC